MNARSETAPLLRAPDADAGGPEEVLWRDGDRVVCRGTRRLADGRRVLAVRPASEHPPRASVERLAHEYALRAELEGGWALLPLDLLRERGGTVLLLEDPGGEPLERLIGRPMEVPAFLRLALALLGALGRLHERGLVHKDLKPASVFVTGPAGVRLTGFGITSRLPRESQAPEAPEVIAGTLEYMAPEQTGRMNRSIDARSDLYSLGVIFYRMLTGALPFNAADPMGWVHAHIARLPTPPADRVPLPAPVSDIVMKLLAKTAEERYQTAAGAAADLRRCLAMQEATGRIEPFGLGSQDVPDVLRIPEKLYGRERELASLLGAFDRVVTQGATELVLVSGDPGVGKSSVVGELHKGIVPPRGLFASGKFEQYRRDVPYATLAQAFQGLVRQVLARSEAEVAQWRATVLEALDGDGELMVRIIPELELLTGRQAPVPELPPQEARARFRRAFRRLLGVFARREHPLVLFLDDLQWLDAASLALLAEFATHPEVRHLLLVGAYRDKEVGPSHPLMRSLDEIRGAGAPVSEILLAPLGPDDVAALVGDALHWDAERAQPLADLVYEKTGGNPFFVIQFLGTLAQEKLLAFDAGAAGWEADLEGIHAKGYTDNVVDLMVGKLGRLPAPAREALKQLACVGSRASCPVLGRVFGQAADAVHAALWPAVSDGLLVRVPGHFAFVHDRLQEAAYSLIPEQQRPEEHLRIGRALLAGMHAGELIDVVDQFNRGASLLVDPDERLRVAELNLRAGRKAKASAAYTSACAYFAAGMALLGEGEWDRHYGLTFGLWLERAECEYLCGNGQQVELLVAQLLARGASRIDLAAAYRLRIDLHVMRSKYPEAVDTALECLRLFGIDMPAHPTREQVDAEYERVWRNLGERPIASLLELPRMTDPDVQAAMGVLALLNSPAYFTDAGLVRLHLCHMVNLTLAHGMSDASPHALGLLGRRYAWFDLPAGWRVARYTDAHAFASLACDLVDKHGLTASRPKVQLTMALTAVWTQPVGVAVDHMRAAHEAAVEGGDLTIACYSLHHLLVDLLLRGDPLEEVWRETERALDFVCKARFRDVADVIVAHQRFIQNLRGRTASFSTFGDAGFDEAAFEAGLGGAGMTMIVCLYWVLKQQARFLSGDHEEAAAAGRKAEALLASAAGHVQLLDYHFYAVLLACATWDALPADARQPAGERLQAHLRQLSEWAGRGGPIFHGRHALALAEVARIEGREQDAQRLYEEAIRHSREQRFVQVEALAYELAGSFYAARGFAEFAALYLRQAHHAWLRWGAAGKARQLEQRHPELREPEPEPAATGILGAPVDQLDLATVIKVSQAVSGEIVLEKMLDTLMRTAIEHAGAGRGLLILPQAGQQTVVAEATTAGDSVVVRMAARPAAATVLPESVLQYVLRTRESVLLDDAVAHGPFAADPYVRDHRARSVLCLPLLNRGQPIGVLYLENNLAPRVFAPARLAVLKLVASEAAVSLENTRLYRDLAEREARIRRLVDANIIGIFIWDLEGRVLDANDAFLRMLGYGRPDLVSGALRWKELTPPEWQLVETQELVPELKSAGSLQPYEKEYFRKDGSRVPVLVGAAAFASGSEGVAFVLDLTERKRAEAESRDSERRAHDMQMRLAEANRLASIGQLSASIAHEINQPLAGIVANANTSLRRLAAVPPNVEGATEIARRLIRDANRASDVIARLRALFGSSQRVTEAVDLNDAAREVVALSSTALQQDRIALRCAFADDLPTVRGDRVQLQQVIMNLLRNACDAMRGLDDRPRQLVLRTVREAGDAIRLSVQDTGVGLDPQRIDKLFDAFYTTKSGGMGIGLSISRTIVERHHGRLWAEPNDGPGATFSFSIPVEPDGTPAAPA